jgi:hypothetical protein
LSILLHFLSQSSLVFFIKNVDPEWVKNFLGLGPTTLLFLVTPLIVTMTNRRDNFNALKFALLTLK